jgi:hypothetical protein
MVEIGKMDDWFSQHTPEIIFRDVKQENAAMIVYGMDNSG